MTRVSPDLLSLTATIQAALAAFEELKETRQLLAPRPVSLGMSRSCEPEGHQDCYQKITNKQTIVQCELRAECSHKVVCAVGMIERATAKVADASRWSKESVQPKAPVEPDADTANLSRGIKVLTQLIEAMRPYAREMLTLLERHLKEPGIQVDEQTIARIAIVHMRLHEL